MFVFQTDSDIVRNVYDSQHNYLIEYNEQCKDKTYCAVYSQSRKGICFQSSSRIDIPINKE